jgi:undecaprenyl-diphosphatase
VEQTAGTRYSSAVTFFTIKGNPLMRLWHILVLAIIQGLAELLPVSSSAHVIVGARLLGYQWNNDFERAFFLVMLHTGTMFSVLIYFWSRWRQMGKDIPGLIVATACTAAVGLPLIWIVEKITQQNVEHLFQNLPLIGCALFAVGVLIIVAGLKDSKTAGKASTTSVPHGAFVSAAPKSGNAAGRESNISLAHSGVIGLVQGIALPFRGFSRSGSTISAGMLLGIARAHAEEFSFALAIILTPPIICYEGFKMWKAHAAATVGSASFGHLLTPGLLGMLFSFAAGLVALKWLSSWLEHGRWKFFGVYCLFAAAAVLAIHFLHIGDSAI